MTDTTSPFRRKSLIDCHVHLAALPEGNNGCIISSNMWKSSLFRFLLWKHHFTPSNPAAANHKYLQDLLRELRASKHVGKAVLLGMDGAYATDVDSTSKPPNSSLAMISSSSRHEIFPTTFWRASPSPQRIDAIEELYRCAEAGAVLVKVLPNA